MLAALPHSLRLALVILSATYAAAWLTVLSTILTQRAWRHHKRHHT